MTFDNGALETGFTLEGWSSAGGTIWMTDLAGTATITKDVGTWDFTSFKIGPFIGNNQMRMESNLGDIYDFGDNIAQYHDVNWTGITSVTLSRISGSGAAADYDDIVYTSNVSVGVNQEEPRKQPTIYPNPSNGQFSIDLGGFYEDVQIKIVDLYGKTIEVVRQNNLSQLYLDTEVSVGLYFIEIRNGNEGKSVTMQMVVE